DGSRLAATTNEQVLTVWDTTTGEELLHRPDPSGSLAFAPGGALLASGGREGTVTLRDANTGNTALTLKGHAGYVSSVAFSPGGGRRLVSGSRDGTVKVWDTSNGQETLTLKGHTDWVQSVAFSPDGWRIASGSRDGTVRIWDAKPASGVEPA